MSTPELILRCIALALAAAWLGCGVALKWRHPKLEVTPIALLCGAGFLALVGVLP